MGVRRPARAARVSHGHVDRREPLGLEASRARAPISCPSTSRISSTARRSSPRPTGRMAPVAAASQGGSASAGSIRSSWRACPPTCAWNRICGRCSSAASRWRWKRRDGGGEAADGDGYLAAMINFRYLGECPLEHGRSGRLLVARGGSERARVELLEEPSGKKLEEGIDRAGARALARRGAASRGVAWPHSRPPRGRRAGDASPRVRVHPR